MCSAEWKKRRSALAGADFNELRKEKEQNYTRPVMEEIGATNVRDLRIHKHKGFTVNTKIHKFKCLTP